MENRLVNVETLGRRSEEEGGGSGRRREHYGSSGLFPSPSPSSRDDTQELVRLDNPRPDILRQRNEYISVPACSDLASSSKRPAQPRSPPGRGMSQRNCKNLSSPSNLDRPKLHVPRPNTSSRLGEIRPLVRTNCPRTAAPDFGPPLLPVKHRTGTAKESSSSNRAPTPVNCVPTASQEDSGKRWDSRPQPSVAGVSGESIRCGSCGGCRCSACTTPRQLPSVILCQNGCLLSSDSVVDAVSCMCCVRGCLYHCGGGSGDDSAGPPRLADSDLCSCESPGCCGRWSCLLAALVCLPCLWCYLPLKGCAELCGLAYSRIQRRGCRCQDRSPYSQGSPSPAPLTRQPKHSPPSTLSHKSSTFSTLGP